MFKVGGDLDLYQRMAGAGAKIIYLPKFTSVFLKYGESLGDRSVELYKKERAQLSRNNGEKLYIRVIYKIARLCAQLL